MHFHVHMFIIKLKQKNISRWNVCIGCTRIYILTRYVHGTNVAVDHPKKIPTPYGGKLVYTLPGGNLLYLHLKDNQKIRHKKRWSQVSQTKLFPKFILFIKRRMISW